MCSYEWHVADTLDHIYVQQKKVRSTRNLPYVRAADNPDGRSQNSVDRRAQITRLTYSNIDFIAFP